MFRVVENPDGTTTILSSRNNQVVCTVPASSKKTDKQSRGKVHKSSSSKIYLSPRAGRSSDNTPSYVNLDCTVNLFNGIEDESFLPVVEHFPDIDYSTESVNKEQFLQSLNLAPMHKLASHNLRKLQASFPLRHIMRMKEDFHFKATSSISRHSIGYALSSPLGLKARKYKTRDNVIPTVEVAAEPQYSNYCKPQSQEAKELMNRLRVRDPVYPVTFTLPESPQSYHIYSFSRSEKLERYRTIDAGGLNKRARQLEKQCRNFSIDVKKLTEREIRRYTMKKSIRKPHSPSPNTVYKLKSCYVKLLDISSTSSDLFGNLECNEETCSSVNSNAISTSEKMPTRTSSRLQKQLQQSSCSASSEISTRACKVVLHNVLDSLEERQGQYFVKGTSVCARDRSILPYHSATSSPFQKRSSNRVSMQCSNVYQANRCVLVENRFPSQNKRPRPNSIASKKADTPKTQLETDEAKFQVKKDKWNHNSIKASPKHQIANAEGTLYLSAINENLETKEVVFTPIIVFNCFGCGYHKSFRNQSAANADIAVHMDYHAVSQPNLFLKHFKDLEDHTVLIEAFSSFKNSVPSTS